jgi:hypothetical protein
LIEVKLTAWLGLEENFICLKIEIGEDGHIDILIF